MPVYVLGIVGHTAVTLLSTPDCQKHNFSGWHAAHQRLHSAYCSVLLQELFVA